MNDTTSLAPSTRESRAHNGTNARACLKDDPRYACTSDSFMVWNTGASRAGDLFQTAGAGTGRRWPRSWSRISGAPRSPHIAPRKNTVWLPVAAGGADTHLPLLRIPASPAAGAVPTPLDGAGRSPGPACMSPATVPPHVLHAHSAMFAGEVAADLTEELGVPCVLMEHSTAYLRGKLTPPSDVVYATCHRRCRRGHRRQPQAQGSASAAYKSREYSGDTQRGGYASFCAACTCPRPKHLSLRVHSVAGPTQECATFCCERSIAHFLGGVVVLDIVGDGKERPRLESLVRAMQQRHRITFLGSLDTDGVVKALRERTAACPPATSRPSG